MAKLKRGNAVATLGTLVAVAGIAAWAIKMLSRDQTCPNCDKVLRVVSAIQTVCPACGRLHLRA